MLVSSNIELRHLLSGNEAIARGAYEAGVSVCAAYPGTPSTEITPALAFYNTANIEWAVNEKTALEIAVGASFCGARSMVAMKHVGLNVASDPLMTLSYTGVKGGLVIVSADDPSMHSSQNEQDNRHYARFAKIPMLEPSDSQEAKEFTKLAFELSEKYDTPVILRVTTRLCHSKTAVCFDDPIFINKEYSFEKNPSKYVMIPSYARKRHFFIEQRLNIIKDYSELSDFNTAEFSKTSDLGVICSGVAYQYVKETAPEISVLKLGITYPLCEEKIRKFCGKVKKVVVVEELDNFLYTEIKAIGIDVYPKPDKFKVDELNPMKVKEIISGEPAIIKEDILPKPPVMCAGCGHRGVFAVLKKMRMTVMGDIGCYTLGSLPPLNCVDACICMGASVTMMHGMTKVLPERERKKVVAVIGDSTFFHSGITGVIDLVYNKGMGTILILDNQTTAMTGKQDHPGTGYTLSFEPTVKILPEKICEAIGVKNISVVDAYDLKSIEFELIKASERKDVSVIVVRRACVLKDKGGKSSPYILLKDKCVKCGCCVSIGCPAIDGSGAIPEIDAVSCVGCGICAQVCEFGAIGME